MIYHLLLGFVWMSFVRDQTGIYSPFLLLLSLFGSIFPDFEHLLFFFTYGKADEYTAWIRTYIRNRDWRVLVRFLEKGHKYNTKLRYHNIYAIISLIGITTLFLVVHVYSGFIFTGAMLIHYCFDILDDLASLGRLNKNWFRWGKGKLRSTSSVWNDLDKTIPRR